MLVSFVSFPPFFPAGSLVRLVGDGSSSDGHNDVILDGKGEKDGTMLPLAPKQARRLCVVCVTRTIQAPRVLFSILSCPCS